MTRKITSLVLAVLMVVSMMSVMAVSAGAAATVDLSTLTGDYEAKDGDVLTGKLSGNKKITIANGATVTLSGVTITSLDSDAQYAGITPLGNATIKLEGMNTVKNGHEDYPGIYAAENATLTIKGDGSLTASSKGASLNSSGFGCGIGGGYEIPSGNIVIEGGTITATGGDWAAGIGGGDNAACGDITITGGTITATGGKEAAGIGGGEYGADQGSCGNITIADTVTCVTATKGEDAPYSIGAGKDAACGTVTIGGKTGVGITQSPYIYPNFTVTWKNEDGTELEKDEGVGYGTTPTYDGTTPQKDDDERYTYSFEGWSPEVTAATGDAEYTATYTKTAKTAKLVLHVGENGKVVMNNGFFGNAPYDASSDAYTNVSNEINVYSLAKVFVYDGHTMKVDEGGSVKIQPDGELSFYPSADNNGTITAIPDEGYAFYGWYEGDELYSENEVLEYQNINLTTTLTAKFAKAHTVTWKNEDGSVLKTDKVAEGKIPTYTGETPTKADDDSCTYTFEGWSPEVTAVTGDAEYTATFSATEKPILSGNLRKGLVIDAGKTIRFAMTKTADSWAIFGLQVYLDDVLVKSVQTEQLQPTEPDRYYTTTKKCIVDSYSGSGNSYPRVYHTLRLKSLHTVTWKNDDGMTLETDVDVVAGKTPTYNGTTPTKANDDYHSYNFSGWTDGTNTYGASDTLPAVTGDVTYTAKYTVFTKQFTVFVKTTTGKTITANGVSGDTTVAQLKDMVVAESGIPAAQQKLIFAGKQMENEKTLADYRIQKESTIHVVAKTYTVTWKNGDDVLETDNDVPYGTTPTYDGETPTKESTAEYKYTFAGWSDGTNTYAANELPAVSGDVTYTAVFTPNAKTLQDYVDEKMTTGLGLDFADASNKSYNITSANKVSLLGVQLRKLPADTEETEYYYDEAGNKVEGIRFVASMTKDFYERYKNNAGFDYGFIVNNHVYSCKGKNNNISENHGNIDSANDYALITMGVKGFNDENKDRNLNVKFYVTDGTDTVYANYAGHDANEFNTTFANVVAALG